MITSTDEPNRTPFAASLCVQAGMPRGEGEVETTKTGVTMMSMPCPKDTLKKRHCIMGRSPRVGFHCFKRVYVGGKIPCLEQFA